MPWVGLGERWNSTRWRGGPRGENPGTGQPGRSGGLERILLGFRFTFFNSID